MIIGDLLYEKASSKVGIAPIKSLSVFLSKPYLAIKIESTHKGYTGAFLTFKKLLSVGEVITLETSVKLNFAEAIQIPDGDNPYNLLIDFPAWLPDVNVKIWEVLEMPAFSLTGSSIIGTRKGVPVRTPVNASTTAVALLAARTGRVGLDIINESAGVMYVRYAVVASPASATTKDAVVPPNTTYEFPGLPPESAINAVWTIGTGSCTVVEWTET